LVDRYFMLLHNILPLWGRLAGFGLEAGACGHCGGLEDVQHFFQRCPLVTDSWESLYFKLVGLLPGLPSDFDLIMLAFPAVPVAVERLVVAHLGVFVAE
jgi:hypothetical protein